jgi:hypothetical protein
MAEWDASASDAALRVGHYVAHVWRAPMQHAAGPAEGQVPGAWWRISDQQALRESQEQALSAQAYLLAYVQQPG